MAGMKQWVAKPSDVKLTNMQVVFTESTTLTAFYTYESFITSIPNPNSGPLQPATIDTQRYIILPVYSGSIADVELLPYSYSRNIGEYRKSWDGSTYYTQYVNRDACSLIPAVSVQMGTPVPQGDGTYLRSYDSIVPGNGQRRIKITFKTNRVYYAADSTAPDKSKMIPAGTVVNLTVNSSGEIVKESVNSDWWAVWAGGQEVQFRGKYYYQGTTAPCVSALGGVGEWVGSWFTAISLTPMTFTYGASVDYQGSIHYGYVEAHSISGDLTYSVYDPGYSTYDNTVHMYSRFPVIWDAIAGSYTYTNQEGLGFYDRPSSYYGTPYVGIYATRFDAGATVENYPEVGQTYQLLRQTTGAVITGSSVTITAANGRFGIGTNPGTASQYQYQYHLMRHAWTGPLRIGTYTLPQMQWLNIGGATTEVTQVDEDPLQWSIVPYSTATPSFTVGIAGNTQGSEYPATSPTTVTYEGNSNYITAIYRQETTDYIVELEIDTSLSPETISGIVDVDPMITIESLPIGRLFRGITQPTQHQDIVYGGRPSLYAHFFLHDDGVDEPFETDEKAYTTASVPTFFLIMPTIVGESDGAGKTRLVSSNPDIQTVLSPGSTSGSQPRRFGWDLQSIEHKIQGDVKSVYR